MPLFPSILFNLLLLAVDFFTLRWLRAEPTAKRWRRGAEMLAVAAGLLTILFTFIPFANPFRTMRLVSYGVFLHAPLWLVIAAWFLWRERRPLAIVSAGLGLTLMAIAIDAFLIEPHWLAVTRYRIASAKIARPVRIVVIADLQTDAIGPYERDALRRALEGKPDLVLFAGDYLQTGREVPAELRAEAKQCLRESGFDGSVPAFAIRGNLDDGNWRTIFATLPIATVERSQTFPVHGLALTCLSLEDSFNAKLRVAAPGEGFHVVVGHAPNYALGQIEADLLLAGHTHGGQVRLPLVGPLLNLARVPRSWTAGQTELPSGVRLIVSRGVGMERGEAPRLRFLCRPELVVIDLVPEER
jgi:predicted MPP superfamily phosphohydrolase